MLKVGSCTKAENSVKTICLFEYFYCLNLYLLRKPSDFAENCVLCLFSCANHVLKFLFQKCFFSNMSMSVNSDVILYNFSLRLSSLEGPSMTNE